MIKHHPLKQMICLLLFAIWFVINSSGNGFASDANLESGLPFANIKELDLNGDGFINPGKEAKLLGTYRDRMSPVQIGFLYLAEIEEDPNGGVPLSQFITNKWFEHLESACNPGQRFFLRDRVINSSILQPDLKKVGGDQAVISTTHNNSNDEWSWSLKGAVTAVPLWNKCTVPDDWQNNELALSAVAIAPFAEFSGFGRTGKKGNSSLLMGANIELQLFSGPLFDIQQINILPSYQTDFDFDSEIYRVGFDWYPVRNSIHLGGYIGLPERLEYWWTLRGGGDFLSVKNAGRTNYTAGHEYGWLKAEIGGHIEYNPGASMPILFADASYALNYDVLNSIHVDNLLLGAGIYLDSKKNTSLQVTYEKGTDLSTFAKKDEVLLRFGVKF